MSNRRIVITDLTRMAGERVCLAGYPIDNPDRAGCIRPDARYGGITESWLLKGMTAVIRPFGVVEIELVRHRPIPPHCEDWIINERHRRPQQILDSDARRALLGTLDDGSIGSIFGAPLHADQGWWIQAGTGARSLGTIRPATVTRVRYFFRTERKRWEYRIVFNDASNTTYDLAVTDLAFRYFLDHQRIERQKSQQDVAGEMTTTLREASELFFRVGLTRPPQDRPTRCYLQLTGVYSFPDYLNGWCFADFPAYKRLLAERLNLDDVPF